MIDAVSKRTAFWFLDGYLIATCRPLPQNKRAKDLPFILSAPLNISEGTAFPCTTINSYTHRLRIPLK